MSDTVIKTMCPICKERELTEHCAAKGCGWNSCENPRCTAMLHLAKGIGHCLHPQKLVDRKTNTIQRIRLILTNGLWYDRDIVGG